MDGCRHEYQLETVGDVYLTGALVCRLCSFREGMSLEQFGQHSQYPRHNQSDVCVGDTVEARANHARELYRQRLRDQLQQLISESLQPRLREEDCNEMLTEVIEEALFDLMKSCQNLVNDSGLPAGKDLAGLIGRRFGGNIGTNQQAQANK
jgi:hypothetical protein